MGGAHALQEAGTWTSYADLDQDLEVTADRSLFVYRLTSIL